MIKAWPAPAKINLYLHVRARRADGMHELETQFQFLEFADTLSFADNAHEIRRIDRHDFDLPHEDLIVRAAKLLRIESGCARGADITLRKVIPPGSGLGGGSSNAATTLLALNQMWQLGWTRARLAKLALRLGADVPVFLHGRAAIARGVGEKFAPSSPPERWLCVYLPAARVSTARVFAHPRLRPCSEARAPHGNDLEKIAALLHPEIATALIRLRRHANARMSGSGGALFADFDSRAEAERAAAQLPEMRGIVTRSRNRHPLAD